MTPPSTRAFTLLEILAVVAVVLILAALVFPAVGKFIEKANGTKCLANLKTIGSASAAYSGDHNGDFPPAGVGVIFAPYIFPYLGRIPWVGEANFMSSPLICPGARTSDPDASQRHRGIYTLPTEDPETGKRVSYGLSYAQNVYAPGNGNNAGVPKRVLAEMPSQMMLYMDMEGHYIVTVNGFTETRKRWLLNRHAGRVNAVFADGSVRTLNFEDIPPSNPTGSPYRFWSGKGKKWPE